MKRLLIFFILFVFVNPLFAQDNLVDVKKEELQKYTEEQLADYKESLVNLLQKSKTVEKTREILTKLSEIGEDPLSISKYLFSKLDQDSINIGGFVHQSYLETTANKLSRQGWRGTEIGINMSGKFSNFFSATAQVAYRPYMSWDNDDDNFKVDYAVLDLHNGAFGNVIGARCGRLITPYGFFNFNNTNPFYRQGITLVRNIYYDYNEEIFQAGDGCGAYLYLTTSNFTASFEYQNTVREDVKDEINYTHDPDLKLDKIKLKDYQHIEIDNTYFALRWNRSKHITEGEITKEYWAKRLPAGTPESFYPTTGFVDVHLILEYYGLQLFHPSFNGDLTYEYQLTHYTLDGNFDEIASEVGMEMKEWTEPRHHLLFRYSYYPWKSQFYSGYSWNPTHTNGTYGTERERTWEKYIGVKYDIFSSLVFRAEYHQAYGVYFLADSINPLDNNERTDRWDYWGTSITYGF